MKHFVFYIKIIFIILVSFTLCKCATKNEKFYLIEKSIDFNSDKGCDTTTLINKTIKFNYDFFKNYHKAELKFINNDFPSHHPYIRWIDNDKKWVLSKEDVNFMTTYENKIVHLKKSNLKTNKVIVLTSSPKFINEIEKNKDFTKQIINCNYLLQFSLPVFNKKRDKAVLMSKLISNGYCNYYIFIKEKKEWILVGISNNYSM